MARKNPFARLMEDQTPSDGTRPVPDYTIKGASKSIISTIDELAFRADTMLEGETVVQLDPDLVDPSFLRDRLEDDSPEFLELKQAIDDRGQDTPILVRPHPRSAGRYMVVFGHRRLSAAKALGRKVRAVVKSITDEEHVVAQGQENSARANLSFIERAAFAHELSRLNYDSDNAIVLKALSIDKSTLSKMLSVASIPRKVLETIGPAKAVGRDRWYEMKLLLEKPEHLKAAMEATSSGEFLELSSDERFNRLLLQLKQLAKPRRPAAPRSVAKWEPSDKRVTVDATSDGRRFVLALRDKDAVGFGEYISEQLPDLYAKYRNHTGQGD